MPDCRSASLLNLRLFVNPDELGRTPADRCADVQSPVVIVMEYDKGDFLLS
jgi:hypothetical protein